MRSARFTFAITNTKSTDNVTWIHGSHSFKAGGLYRHYSTNTMNAARSRGDFTFNGTFTGNSFADFLLGSSVPRPAHISPEYFWHQPDAERTLLLSGRLEDYAATYAEPRPALRVEPSAHCAAQPDGLHRPGAAADRGGERRHGKINTSGQQVGQFLYPLFADVIVPSSKVGLGPSLRHLDKNNFAPRFGAGLAALPTISFCAPDTASSTA